MNLRCGPFDLLYENGFLRYIHFGDQEIVRMIYFALRDENWSTHPLEINDENITAEDDAFTITYTAINTNDGIPLLKWRVSIEGTPEGRISFALEGEVLETHRKNRAGFCMLHPLKETIGQPVEIRHPDGSNSKHTFPKYIQPDDPFTEISGMKWRTGKDWFTLDFEGDIFETEDQRNWSDASFKTFCTPLRLPFPAELKKGDTISQKVIFTPGASLTRPEAKEEIEILITGTTHDLPAIGIGSSDPAGLTPPVVAILGKAGLHHYRVDVDLGDHEWSHQVKEHIEISTELDLKLELVVHVANDTIDDVETLIRILKNGEAAVFKITLLSKGSLTTTDAHVALLDDLLSAFPMIQTGAGTDFNFTELNRHRFDAGGAHYVTFALDPQEHATDNLTIVENLEAQYYGVLSAREIYQREVHVSPVLLKRKYNPYATDPKAFIDPEEKRTDRRQITPFTAAWTMGSIKWLTLGGAKSVTYFQCYGPHGIVSESGEFYPVYEALQKLLWKKQTQVLAAISSAPRNVDALAFPDGTMVLWNYTGETQRVRIGEREVVLNPYAVQF
jgi:D-apionolactonase